VLQSLGHVSPTVLLGADVVCWPTYVAPFLQTVKHLLMPPTSGPSTPPRALYLGFVCRATVTRDIFLDTAKEMGLLVEKLPSPEIPEPERASVVSSLALELLQVTIDESSPLAFVRPVLVAPEGSGAPY